MSAVPAPDAIPAAGELRASASRPLEVVGSPAIDATAAAALRLAASRGRLRLAMLPPPPEPGGSSSFVSGLEGIARGWLDNIKALPLVSIALDTVEDWWARHPLHAAATVAADASRRLATPVARTHPLVLVAGAAVVGALLVLSRPWRWLLRPALLAGLLPALAARALRELPVHSLLSAFTSFKSPAAGGRAEFDRSKPGAQRAAAEPRAAYPAGAPAAPARSAALDETVMYP